MAAVTVRLKEDDALLLAWLCEWANGAGELAGFRPALVALHEQLTNAMPWETVQAYGRTPVEPVPT